MKKIKYQFLTFLGAFAVMCVFTTQVWACSCLPPDTKKLLSEADVIIAGQAMSVERYLEPLSSGRKMTKFIPTAWQDTPIVVEVGIYEMLKGQIDPDQIDPTSGFLKLYTNQTKASCSGYDFKTGGDYLIYAYQRKVNETEHWSIYNFPSGTYGVGGVCGGTKRLVEADAEIQEIKAIMEKWKTTTPKRPD